MADRLTNSVASSAKKKRKAKHSLVSCYTRLNRIHSGLEPLDEQNNIFWHSINRSLWRNTALPPHLFEWDHSISGKGQMNLVQLQRNLALKSRIFYSNLVYVVNFFLTRTVLDLKAYFNLPFFYFISQSSLKIWASDLQNKPAFFYINFLCQNLTMNTQATVTIMKCARPDPCLYKLHYPMIISSTCDVNSTWKTHF